MAFRLILFKARYPSTRFLRVKKTIGTFYSQDGQDLLIAAILFNRLKNNSEKLIVDIGANHPIDFSNSYFLEKYFGCKTLAIDPLAEFGKLWEKSRPKAEFLSSALGSKNGMADIKIPIGGSNMFSSLVGGVMKEMHKGQFETRKVKVTTLRQVLEDRNITEVLLMSLDVEGFELEVLRGIDFDRVKFDAIICENNSEKPFGSDEIRDLLMQNGYIYYARLGWLDDLFISPTILREIC